MKPRVGRRPSLVERGKKRRRTNLPSLPRGRRIFIAQEDYRPWAMTIELFPSGKHRVCPSGRPVFSFCLGHRLRHTRSRCRQVRGQHPPRLTSGRYFRTHRLVLGPRLQSPRGLNEPDGGPPWGPNRRRFRWLRLGGWRQGKPSHPDRAGHPRKAGLGHPRRVILGLTGRGICKYCRAVIFNNDANGACGLFLQAGDPLKPAMVGR
jgi:hypothetical protein